VPEQDSGFSRRGLTSSNVSELGSANSMVSNLNWSVPA